MNNESFEGGATFWEHVEELRQTVIRALFIIAAGVGVSLYFYQSLFHLLTFPLSPSGLEHETIHYERIVNTSLNQRILDLNDPAIKQIQPSEGVKELETGKYQLPPGGRILLEKSSPANQLMVLGPIDGMCITLKVCFWTGLFGTSPLWLYLILQFMAPALDRSERWLIVPFLLLSLLFLSAGILFGFFVTIPIANQYLSLFNQTIGLNFWTLSNYLDYTGLLLIGNGLAFELAVVLFFLVHFGVIKVETMKAKRRHMVVAAFILGALLTPPDVLTQVMMAIPLIILYECVILYGVLRKKLLKQHRLTSLLSK